MATYLITQATGQQSQQVIRHLLAVGAKIHAVVRDLSKVPELLKSPGITLFQGESKNVEDILKAAQGCQGAFLNTVPFPGLELLQARSIVEACQKAGIEHVVAATSFTANNRAMWDTDATKAIQLDGYFSSKAQVEEIVRAGNFKAYTILRPAVLHQDFHLPGSLQNFPRLASHGVIDDLLINGSKVPFSVTHDVGRFAAAAFQDPIKFAGQEINLVFEQLDFDEVVGILAKVAGRKVGVVKRTFEELQQEGLFVFGQAFHLWSNLNDFGPLVAASREAAAKLGIAYTPLADALQKDSALVIAGLPSN